VSTLPSVRAEAARVIGHTQPAGDVPQSLGTDAGRGLPVAEATAPGPWRARQQLWCALGHAGAL